MCRRIISFCFFVFHFISLCVCVSLSLFRSELPLMMIIAAVVVAVFVAAVFFTVVRLSSIVCLLLLFDVYSNESALSLILPAACLYLLFVFLDLFSHSTLVFFLSLSLPLFFRSEIARFELRYFGIYTEICSPYTHMCISQCSVRCSTALFAHNGTSAPAQTHAHAFTSKQTNTHF